MRETKKENTESPSYYVVVGGFHSHFVPAGTIGPIDGGLL